MMGEVARSYLGGRLQVIEGGGEHVSRGIGPSGAVYQLVTDVVWDDEKLGYIGVVVDLYEDAVPHGGLCSDFIMAPDGSFVGE